MLDTPRRSLYLHQLAKAVASAAWLEDAPLAFFP